MNKWMHIKEKQPEVGERILYINCNAVEIDTFVSFNEKSGMVETLDCQLIQFEYWLPLTTLPAVRSIHYDRGYHDGYSGRAIYCPHPADSGEYKEYVKGYEKGWDDL